MTATDRIRPHRARLTALRDETTRHLSAAVHVDGDLADAMIREFLVEPLRAIAPSPGVDAFAVLREAVAARARRMLRDWCLLIVLIAFFATSLTWGLIWLAVAYASAALGSPSSGWRHRGVHRVVAIALVPLALVVVTILFAVRAVSAYVQGTAAFLEFFTTPAVGPWTVALGGSALAILVGNEFLLAQLFARSFRRGLFEARPNRYSWPGERWARNFNVDAYRDQLARIEQSDSTANLVVYRGYEPFVGAGTRVEKSAISLAVSLEPDDDSIAEPFTLADLYDHVSTRMLELRDAASLAPSERLGGLAERVQVIVPIQELFTNAADPATKDVLPGLDRRPAERIGEDRLAGLVEQPLEWMRYYRCYQLETWDRGLTVSAYLTFGMSERTLFLEWTPCLLFPLDRGYRTVDSTSIEPLSALGSAALSWIRLPVALLSRLRSLFTWLRPMPDQPGMVFPDRYAASASLRELAAADELDNYFQVSDVSRYLQVLSTRMTSAVGEFLADRGISVTDFMEQAKTVINQTTVMGNMVNSVIGNRNTVAGNRATHSDQ
ncbi:MAG TPA: hypothetical protein VJX10_16165 [Pseudonocardiaceae bacterium]|nr:hypothetical protein [Pseudonocardiaceae bacterium]